MTYLDVKLNNNQKSKLRVASRTKIPSQNLEFLSPQNSYQKNNLFYKERALKQNSQHLSFKGSFFRFLNGYSAPISNYQAILKKADSIMANVPSEILAKIKKISPDAIIQDADSIKFKETGIVEKIFKAAVYPIVQMPFDLLNFTVKSLQKIPGLSNSKTLDNLYNSSFLSKNREKMLMSEQIGYLQNLFDGASKLDFSKSENKDAFIKQVHALFDPKKGNYSTAHERSLNRIVSGMIPAYFLANDAYNLSRCCDDNKDAADKESKIRFKQEVARVGSTAYIQLVLLGALSKIINSSMFGTVLSLTGVTIFTELFSRKLSGKPVKFLNKNEAQKQYEKEYKDFSKQQEKDGNTYTYYKMPVAFKNQVVFASFKGGNAADKNQTNKNKPPVTLAGILKYSLYSTIAGFSLFALRKNVKGVDNLFNNIARPFQNYYKKLAFKELSVSKATLTELATRFKKAGYSDIASAYKSIINSTKGENIIFGKQNTTKKPFVDFVIGPFKFIWKTLTLPYNIAKRLLSIVVKSMKTVQKPVNENQILGDGIQHILDKTKNLNDLEFKKFVDEKILSSFDTSGKSSYSNADLAIMTKLFCSAATSYFLIADNYNMVMTKSKGEDKKGAVLKAKERAAQRVSSIFYSTLFIDLFNNTFKRAYHASLLGMSAVTAACTYISEVFTRASIGMPIREKTKAQIMEIENKNNSRDGLAGDYFRFMSRLTGKKVLSERISKG